MMPMALAWCFLCSLATCLTDLIQTFLVPLLVQSLASTIEASTSSESAPSSIDHHHHHSTSTPFSLSSTISPSPSPLLSPSTLSFIESSTNSQKLQYSSSEIAKEHTTSHLFGPLANFLTITSQLLTRLVIYLTINLVCLYTKYLIDLAQRNAFLETRRSIETRAKIERENDKQERLLLSLLPRFVALEIIADIAKEDNHDKLLKNQFHKIYIHSYTNVR